MPADVLDAFVRALADPAAPAPAGVTAHNGPAHRRFSVYRNNVAVGLIEAVGARHPVTRRLLGEDRFRPLARAYVAAEKPASPVLLAYGGGFAAFAAPVLESAGLGDLVGVAALESAWMDAYHAAEAEPAGMDLLAALDPDRLADTRLRIHPSARIVAATGPAVSLWAAARAETLGDVPPADGPQTALVVRPAAEVTVTLLPPADAPFAAAVLAGAPLGAAAAAAVDPAFDFGRALVGLVAAGAVTAALPPSEFTP